MNRLRLFLLHLLGGKPAAFDDALDLGPPAPVDRCEVDFRPGYEPYRMVVEFYGREALPALRARRLLMHVMPDGRVAVFRPFRKVDPEPEPYARTMRLVAPADLVAEAAEKGCELVTEVSEVGPRTPAGPLSPLVCHHGDGSLWQATVHMRKPAEPAPVRRRRINREAMRSLMARQGEYVVEADPSGAVRIWEVPELV